MNTQSGTGNWDRRLGSLLRVVGGSAGEKQETIVTRVTADSREVEPGTIFVAVAGGTHDGHDHCLKAIEQGAIALILQKDMDLPTDIPAIRVQDSRRSLAEIAAAFEGHPSSSLKLVGITGTSGKTTTSYLCESMLEAAGEKVGVIGTVNFRFGSKIYPSTHTTPGAPELQRLLREMKEDGCTAVVMEVSSHALKQYRVFGCLFDAVVFTNLSREHLDFHPDMEDYFQSKALLFTDYILAARAAGKNPAIVINEDDEWGRRLLSIQKAGPGRVATYSAKSRGIELSLTGTKIPVGAETIQSGLIGEFNASNLAAVAGAGEGLGISPEVIAKGLSKLRVVPGRLERVETADTGGPVVLVDYAHKPDALEKVLETLKQMVQQAGRGRLICVFGCGGDRDRGKRPLMGAIAERLADLTWITSDNPRTEDPRSIIQEIIQGLIDPQSERIRVEEGRAEAIEAALQAAQKWDVVLIAGKGHEDYQLILDPSSPAGGPKTTLKIHFDDREVAARVLKKMRKC